MTVLSRLAGLVLLLCACVPVPAAEIGKVLLAAGDTVAVREGQAVKLARGATIQDRDVLRTGPASNLQVLFMDESIVSMRASSELRIDEFRFSGKEDGTERAFLSLLKGGLRTLTGLIGRSNHQNYRMSTNIAHIGIRGTDYSATLCQKDCRNADGSLARDGLYGRTHGASHGTNRIEVANAADRKTFGINENFYVIDSKSPVQSLLVSPDFVSNRLEGRRQGGTPDTATASGNEQTTASSGVQAESRLATPPPATPPSTLEFVTTENLGTSGTPAVISTAAPTIAGLGAFTEAGGFPEPNDGGGFFTVADVVTDPAGAASSLSTPQLLMGFKLTGSFAAGASPNLSEVVTATAIPGNVIGETSPNTVNAHWGRWTAGSITTDAGITNFGVNNQFHYLHGPLAPPEVVAAKSGVFPMVVVGGTTPTNHLGQVGSLSASPLTVDFTARTVTFPTITFSFPSDTFTFAGPNSTPIQIRTGQGAFIDHVVSGTCSGTTCSTSTPATLGKTGIFLGPQADHLGIAFHARTTSGPAASAQTTRLYTCSPSC